MRMGGGREKPIDLAVGQRLERNRVASNGESRANSYPERVRVPQTNA